MSKCTNRITLIPLFTIFKIFIQVIDFCMRLSYVFLFGWFLAPPPFPTAFLHSANHHSFSSLHLILILSPCPLLNFLFQSHGPPSNFLGFSHFYNHLHVCLNWRLWPTREIEHRLLFFMNLGHFSEQPVFCNSRKLGTGKVNVFIWFCFCWNICQYSVFSYFWNN